MANYEILNLSDDNEVDRIIREEMSDKYTNERILIGEDNTCLPKHYLKFADAIKAFEVYDSDVIVATYPKAGTTWTQEMVWLIMNNLDYKGAEIPQPIRFPFLEISAMTDWERIDADFNSTTRDGLKNSVEFARQLKHPRCIKTHLPFSLLPDRLKNQTKTPKMIYVMRNPKDTCVSYYHHGKLLQRYRTTLENFVKVFLADKVIYGSYWKHIFGYWEQRKNPNLLIIKYEDMKEDLVSVIKKVANFLNKELPEDQIQKLSEHLSFEAMSKNKAVNAEALLQQRKERKLLDEDGKFIRSGTVGKYKEEMSPEMIKKFDEWIKENIDGTEFGLQYNYSL